MFNCLLCNNFLEPTINLGFGIYKCFKCNKLYIQGFCIDSYLKTFAEKKIDFKDNRHKEILFSKITFNIKKCKVSNALINCTNIICRKNCQIIEYKYKGLIFNYCNYVDFYILNEENLTEYIIKANKISLIYFYIEIILKRIKKLFVEEK